MDINVALAMMRRQVAAYYAGQVVEMSTLVDAFAAIDSWLTRGGFLPLAWTEHRNNMIRASK